MQVAPYVPLTPSFMRCASSNTIMVRPVLSQSASSVW